MKHFWIIILVSGCCSCSRQKTPLLSLKTFYIEKAFNMKQEIVYIDSLCDSISIIPLETSDEILMAGHGRCYLYNNLLFIHHSGYNMNDRLSVFDLSGKYLRDIGRRGQGPGEYISIMTPIGVFFNNDKVYLIDNRAHAILCYTLNGAFVKKNSISQTTCFRSIYFYC